MFSPTTPYQFCSSEVKSLDLEISRDTSAFQGPYRPRDMITANAMSSLKLKFFTLLCEIWIKILKLAINLGDELQVCACAEHLKNCLSLCDYRRTSEQQSKRSTTFPYRIITAQEQEEALDKKQTFRMPDNPTNKLALVCQQIKDEVCTSRTQLSTLILCLNHLRLC